MSVAPISTASQTATPDVAEPVSPGKSKRSFFGLGKKKRDPTGGDSAPTSPSREVTPKIVSDAAPQLPELTSVPPMNASLPPSAPSTQVAYTTPSPPGAQTPKTPTRSLHSASSPVLTPRSTTAPHSPPRGLSTSSSMIFERNVQEHPNSPHQPVPTSSAIPAHIQTDNFIPPVLSASSLAITDRNCDVDEVEIVMHSAHQPALSVVVASAENYSSLDHTEEVSSHSGDDVSSSGGGIGAAAAVDKRRLSFISFADVVQAEQAEQYNDTLTHSTSSPSRGSPVQSAVDSGALSTINERLRRSPSPIRLAGSPPRSSYMAGERSPGSPGKSAADHLGVERGGLAIETMRQALRKTRSGDLGQRNAVGDSSAFTKTT